MNRTRLAWLVLAALLLIVGVLAGPPLWRQLMFETVHDLGTSGVGKPGERITPSVFAYTQAREPRFSWVGEPSGFIVWFPLDGEDDEECLRPTLWHYDADRKTTYTEDGVVRLQADDSQEYNESPWPYPIAYTPDDVRALIREAKLYVQAAAQRGEVKLQRSWESVE